MDSGIYRITCLIDGRKYIGSAVKLKDRKYLHFSEHQHNIFLKRAMKKHGYENFSFEVIEYCEPENLIEREQYYLDSELFAQEWIKSNHSDKRFRKLGYNICPTAGSLLGTRRTQSQREKNRIQKLKEWSDPEARKKYSAAQKGCKRSPEHIEAIRKSLIGHKRYKGALNGRKRTPEDRVKLSIAGLNEKKFECPHCKRHFKKCNLTLWHGPKCKSIKNKSIPLKLFV